MNLKIEMPVSGGMMASVASVSLFLCAVCYVRGQMPSALPTVTSYNCLEQFYGLLESVVVFGSPAQWMVAFFGLCLYPAFSRTSRSACASSAGAVGDASAQHAQEPPRAGPGSHSIQLESQREATRGPRPSVGGFFKRLRRVLAEGRAQARRLCGQDSVRTAMTSLSRRRSFASRSSKSEDMLSSRLSMDSSLRSTQQSYAGGLGRRGLLQRKGSGGGAGGSRWQPSMSRIASGQHLAGMAASESSMSSVTTGKRLEILSYNGFQAVDCMQHETTDPLFRDVREVVTDAHLLQFGALVGEASAELALSQGGNPGAVGPSPASLFGSFDRAEMYRQGWELIVEEHKPGLHYWSWRRYLRRGLYMYKSKTVYETATTAQIMDFTFDVEFRRTWDDSMACQIAIAPPTAAGAAAAGVPSASVSLAEAEAKSTGGKSAFMYARTKFPPPMASREYTYARRCWAKLDDGGCYCISRSCPHPAPPPAGGRTVRVTDFVSGYVIRSGKGVFDTASPAVEVVNVYFEDSCMPSGIINMGIRRALWPMVQKAEAAFRDYLLTRVHGNLERPPPERPVATDSLGAAIGAPGAQVARAAAADADAASCMGALPLLNGLSWRMVSPYVVYRGYVAIWRGTRAAMLSTLSCCMSLWCNATGICVGALDVSRGAAHTAAAVVKSALQALPQAVSAGTASLQAKAGKATSTCQKAKRAFTAVVWPWEGLAAVARPAACAERATSSSGSIQRSTTGSTSSTSSSAAPLASHPLPPKGDAFGTKRLSLVQRESSGNISSSAGGATEGAQSPRGSNRRARPGLARRCALLAVKVAKVAGAGLLLGRVTRTEGNSSEPAAATAQQTAQVARQQRRLETARLTVSGHGW